MLIMFIIEFVKKWNRRAHVSFLIMKPSLTIGTIGIKCSIGTIGIWYTDLQCGQKFLFSPDFSNCVIQVMWYVELAQLHGNATSWFISKSTDSKHIRQSLSFINSLSTVLKLCRCILIISSFKTPPKGAVVCDNWGPICAPCCCKCVIISLLSILWNMRDAFKSKWYVKISEGNLLCNKKHT